MAERGEKRVTFSSEIQSDSSVCGVRRCGIILVSEVQWRGKERSPQTQSQVALLLRPWLPCAQR